MLATPVIASGPPSNGPRPINLSKDRKQVISLLNLTFGNRATRTFGERISLNSPGRMAVHWNALNRNIVPGFVWEESGIVLGNVTLLETEIRGRFIIANVAVHPDYQRRGIARALMHESLEYISQLNGHSVLLQVEKNNPAAINLYQSLGFEAIGTMSHWYAIPARLTLKKLVPSSEILLRSLGSQDWQDAYELDRQVVAPDLNWPIPPPASLFKTGLWRQFIDFLNGQKMEGWLVDTKAGKFPENRLIGMITIFSSWGSPTQLRLRVDSGWQGRLEHTLLHKALEKLKGQSAGSVSITHPADDPFMNEALAGANFQLRRQLKIMALRDQ